MHQRARSQGEGEGERTHMKGAWMLDVSLRGVNFGFWSHLGGSGQNVAGVIGEGEGEQGASARRAPSKSHT